MSNGVSATASKQSQTHWSMWVGILPSIESRHMLIVYVVRLPLTMHSSTAPDPRWRLSWICEIENTTIVTARHDIQTNSIPLSTHPYRWSCDLFAQHALLARLLGINMTADAGLVQHIFIGPDPTKGIGESFRNVRLNWFAVWFMILVVM